MKYKLYIFCPPDEKLLDDLIEAASKAGAGWIGKYSHNAFVTRGTGIWKAEPGSNPTEGKVGELMKVDHFKIEMPCEGDKILNVVEAVRKVHPYEEVEIDFVKLDESFESNVDPIKLTQD